MSESVQSLNESLRIYKNVLNSLMEEISQSGPSYSENRNDITTYRKISSTLKTNVMNVFDVFSKSLSDSLGNNKQIVEAMSASSQNLLCLCKWSPNSVLSDVAGMENSEIQFWYQGDNSVMISEDLISKFPGSYLYRLVSNPSMKTIDGKYYLDHNFLYINKIIEYMQTGSFHCDSLSIVQKFKLFQELEFLSFPLNDECLQLFKDIDSHRIEIFRSNPQITVNGYDDFSIIPYLKQFSLLEDFYNSIDINKLQYSSKNHYYYFPLTLVSYHYILDYIKNGRISSIDLNFPVSIFMNELRLLKIPVNNSIIYSLTSLHQATFLHADAETLLFPYIGSFTNWKLTFDASCHQFSASSFHEYCDDQGETIVFIVVKSIQKNMFCVFGGYTSLGWSKTLTIRKSIFFIILFYYKLIK
ncbi:hypothetical protein WA158_008248 [Blastocystis sp. Blastoise]